MKVELTDDMIIAIEVAFAELENSGVWTDYVTEKEHEQVNNGSDELSMLIREYQDKNK